MGIQAHQEDKPIQCIGLQPVALVDYVARVDWSLLDAVQGERGGSIRVSGDELQSILSEVKTHMLPGSEGTNVLYSLAGGSVANTIRGLAAGFGVQCRMVGARGDDSQGQMFSTSMEKSGVDLLHLRIKKGPTGQCACLVDIEGNRTMRPCLSDAVRLQAEELTRNDFQNSNCVILNGYGFYGEQLVEKAVEHAKMEGALVSMDLASFEVVRTFRSRLLKLLESKMVDICFANEDEAHELRRGEKLSDVESTLEFLSTYCNCVVIMLGSKGCIARRGQEVVRIAGIQDAKVVDTTGAGDLFASGFLYGLLHGFSLETCCQIGCCAGAAVIQNLGGEVNAEGWTWMYKQMKVQDLPLPKLLQFYSL